MSCPSPPANLYLAWLFHITNFSSVPPFVITKMFPLNPGQPEGGEQNNLNGALPPFALSYFPLPRVSYSFLFLTIYATK